MIRLVLPLVAAAFMAAFSEQSDGPPLTEALEELDRYLVEYEPKLSALVADEDFRQETPPLTSIMVRPYLSRRLESEIAFTRLPGEKTWLGFRRVRKIDGKKIADTQPALVDLLSLGSGDRLAQAQLLVMQSSEHNLGLPRTINLPNLPLELLQAKYRHRFRVNYAGTGRLRGRRITELQFTELAAPSIVAYGKRDDLLSRMIVSIDLENGAVLRARVRFRADRIDAEPRIDVEFENHRQLGLLVPTRMDETFLIHLSAAGTGRATYSNFRRFQTAARIVPQP